MFRSWSSLRDDDQSGACHKSGVTDSPIVIAIEIS